jgi:hypothetical protein
MLAASKNQAESKILAVRENQAESKILAARENQAESKILAARQNQAESKILETRENQADDRIIVGVEIPALGEKPAFEEKLVESEKQATCLLFRLGGISNC